MRIPNIQSRRRLRVGSYIGEWGETEITDLPEAPTQS